ncbi:MAG: S41 family peptidase, partial [Verrucomicrobiota bacterium]
METPSPVVLYCSTFEAMKVTPRLLLTVSLLFAAAVSSPAKGLDNAEISQVVAVALEENHYSRHPLDAELSRRFLDDYLDILDGDHLFFTRTDVDEIVRDHGGDFAREIKSGRTTGAWGIYDRYAVRAGMRLQKILEFLKETNFDFSSGRTAEIDRAHSPWPLDEAEADKLWQDQIESEVLDEKLNGTPVAECVQTVRERYEQMQKGLGQQTRKEVLALVLSALARAYDPHSDYLTKTDLEDLDSDMRLSMVGIGVVLEPEGRYVKIVSFLPGGPAAGDGRLKINDRIVAVAHGNGNFTDIVGMNFDRILELLRVKKGTQVRLKVVSPHGAELSERREVDLVTRKIELTGEAARAEVIERTHDGGGTERLGWLTLPSFYGDPQHQEDRSASRDVRNLLIQLKRRQINGLVIDLRDNPGGELEEAVDLGGFFLGPVPIVQEKDSRGKVYVSKAVVKKIYNGPVVVLTNHLTASAAELFAAALKDYHRAVIVGGNFSTYGKGSIQTVVDLSEVLPR